MSQQQQQILLAWIRKNPNGCEKPRQHGKALSGGEYIMTRANHLKMIIVSAIAAVLLLGGMILAEEANAETVESNMLGQDITAKLDENGTLTLTGTGVTDTYAFQSGTAKDLFEGTIRKVVIEDGITGIGSFEFQYCDMLVSVQLPPSLTAISEGAFHGCDSLRSVTLPPRMNYIGESAFEGCLSLTDISLPYGISSIEDKTFLRTSLKSIAIPESVDYIGDWAIGYGENGLGNSPYEMTVFCCEDSYAEDYARSRGFEINKVDVVYDGGQRIVPWGPELFAYDSDSGPEEAKSGDISFDRQIAKLAVILSSAAYNGNAGSSGKYIYDAYRKLGIPDDDISLYSYPGSNLNRTIDGIRSEDKDLAFSIASKSFEGDTILLITLRGTEMDPLSGRIGDVLKDLSVTSTEFYSVGAATGFYQFYEDVMVGIKDYLKEHPLVLQASKQGSLKALITGHSLGAAGANLLGENLNEYDLLNTNTDDLYVYTFATPKVYSGDASDMAYDGNIFNFLNGYDPVPVVTAGSTSRFGTDLYIMSDCELKEGESIEDLINNVATIMAQHNPSVYIQGMWNYGHRITLEPNCSDWDVARDVLYTDIYGKVTLPKPHREGYKFIGWFTDPDSGKEITSDEMYQNGATLYAHWKPLPAATTVYDDVLKTGNTVYCAGASGIYKAKLKKGKMKSAKRIYRSYSPMFGAYSYISAMSLNGSYLYFFEGSEGVLKSLCRVKTDGKGKKHLADTWESRYGYAISNNRIYYDEGPADEDYSEEVLVCMKLNGSEQHSTDIIPKMTQKKTSAKGYSVKIKRAGKYYKDYLKTPKGTFLLGKCKRGN